MAETEGKIILTLSLVERLRARLKDGLIQSFSMVKTERVRECIETI